MAAGGDALAREASGRVVFVEGALPGERVVVELTDQRKDFARGRVVEVLEPSDARVGAPCGSVARGCGGCQWQHAEIGAQASFKRAIVLDALRRIGRMDDPPVAEDVVRVGGGRTTLRLAVVDGRAGFRRRHGHDVVEVDECLVAHPLLQDLLVNGNYDGADEVTLRASVATGERLVVCDPSMAGVLVPDDVVLVSVDDPGLAALNEDVAGRRWRVSALSFFQSGPEAADALVDAVRFAAEAEGARVLDAYAGVGLLGGSLDAASIVALESSPWSAADAQVNLADLDAVVVEGEVARAAPELSAKGRPFDVVVADPARPGLGPTAAAALAGVGAERLVLVSCDPASFARDVRLLADHGYRLDHTQVLDLFPHTFHVEAVSRFNRV